MLLTRISLDCGYPAAALRERIYALSDVGMYGILLHTGTSGSEGTLGGLVESGAASVSIFLRPSRKPGCAQTIRSAPSMIRAPSTTPMHLLGAACHGCLLIAETSCEQRNDWLDRALVVPTLAVTDAAFFP